MPITGIEDKPPVSEPLNADGSKVASPHDRGQGDTFFGTFKTREEADKGFKEVQAAKTRAEQEASELRKNHEKLRDEYLGQVTEILRNQRNPQPREESILESEQKFRDLAGKIEEGGTEALLTHLGGLLSNLETKFKTEVGSHEQKLVQQIEALSNKLGEISLETNPVYQTQRELVDQYVEKYGLSREKALQIVADQNPVSIESGSRSMGNLSSSSQHNENDGPKPLTEDEIKQLRALGIVLTDAERARLEGRINE